MFWPLILLSFTIQANALNLLSVGDSFDRYWGHEWCKRKREMFRSADRGDQTKQPPMVQIWGDPRLDPNKLFHNSPMYCRDPISNDSVAEFGLLGSAMNGPYQLNKNEDKMQTHLRVPLGLNGYFKTFDIVPDRIVIHTNAWDGLYYFTMEPPSSELSQEQLERQYQNTNNLINLIQDIVNSEIERRKSLNPPGFLDMHGKDYHNFKVDYGLRTQNWKPLHGVVINQLNEQIRNISKTRNMSLYDMDYDIWSHVNYRRQSGINTRVLQRDHLHTAEYFSYPANEKQLSRRYSQFFYPNGIHVPPLTILKSFKGYESVDFHLMRAVFNNRNDNSSLHDSSNRNNFVDMRDKNSQLLPEIDTSRDGTMRGIPGWGPVYFSRFINNKRYKWFIGDLSAQYHTQNNISHSNNMAQSSSVVARSNVRSNNRQLLSQQAFKKNADYEAELRLVLEDMLLTANDMILLPQPLLDSVPTLGIMPILFHSTENRGFTCNSANKSSNEIEYYVIFGNNHDIWRIPSPPLQSSSALSHQPVTAETVNTNNSKNESKPNISVNYFHYFNLTANEITHNVHRIWLDEIYAPTTVMPNYYGDNTLIRYVKDRTVYLVLNEKRHAFTSASAFMNRGFDFSNVLVIDNKFWRYVEILPLGEPLP